MKTLARGLALGICLIAASNAVAQEAPVKIAVVDLERVVVTSQSGQNLQGKLEAFARTVQTEGETKAASLRDLQQRLNDGANALTEDKLNELRKQFEDAQIDLRRFQDDKEREGAKLQADGLKEIEEQLKPVFDQVRDELGLDLILNNVPGVVVMANERVDITGLIIERFNAAQSSGG